jgi:uncharacterized integral membrane protein
VEVIIIIIIIIIIIVISGNNTRTTLNRFFTKNCHTEIKKPETLK